MTSAITPNAQNVAVNREENHSQIGRQLKQRMREMMLDSDRSMEERLVVLGENLILWVEFVEKRQKQIEEELKEDQSMRKEKLVQLEEHYVRLREYRNQLEERRIRLEEDRNKLEKKNLILEERQNQQKQLNMRLQEQIDQRRRQSF